MNAGLAIAEIAARLGFHRSTVYRELNRNSCVHGYRPDKASQQAWLRQQDRKTKLDKDARLKRYVLERLADD